MACLLLTACSINPVNTNIHETSNASQRPGFIATENGYIQEDYETRGSQLHVGGDMVFSKNQIQTQIEEDQIGLARENSQIRLWPKARVPYEFPPGFEFSAELNFSILEWSRAGVSWIPGTCQ